MYKSMIVCLLILVTAACVPVAPYKVCDNTGACRPMTKQEALEAAEVSKEWGTNSSLTLRITRP